MEGDARINNGAIDVAALIDDRPREKVFRVDRAIYFDPEIYDLELRRIFESNWQFLCHESQIPKSGDYFSTQIGRQPVFAARQKDGTFRAFINSCTHRGALLTPFRQGNGTTLTCRFHGWSFAGDGRCLKIKNEETGFTKDGLDRARFDLTPVARVECYKGFVFGNLAAEGPNLVEFLGEAAKFIDFVADRSVSGDEVLPGSQTYLVHGNWKMQTENAVDGYHTSTVHRVFVTTMKNREDRDGLTGMMRTEAGRIAGEVGNGCYDLGGGHMVIWADRAPPETSPLWELRARIEAEYPPGKARWMLRRGRNLIVYPNFMINDFAATQIRTFRPVAPDKTEITIYCLAPKDESKDARYARLRKFEDFFMASGMATSDDVVALEDAQAGSRARLARWGEMHRGFDTTRAGPDAEAREGGFTPASSNTTWDQETHYHGFYRTWRDDLARVRP